jgi:signal recognition particle GTPase
MTKLDASRADGSLIAVYRKLCISIHFTGTGETLKSLEWFSTANHIHILFPPGDLQKDLK